MGKTDDLAMVYEKILEENDVSSYLAHHGIQGQKWGVKNGPPYPLGKSVSTGKRLKTKRGAAGGQSNKMGTLDERAKRKADKKKLKEIRKERRKIAKNASLLSDKELNDHIRRIKQENYLKKIVRENEGKREMKPGTPIRDMIKNEGIRMTLQMLVKNGPKKISELANFIKKKRTDMLLNNLYGGNPSGSIKTMKDLKKNIKKDKQLREFFNKEVSPKYRQSFEEYDKLYDKLYDQELSKGKDTDDYKLAEIAANKFSKTKIGKDWEKTYDELVNRLPKIEDYSVLDDYIIEEAWRKRR